MKILLFIALLLICISANAQPVIDDPLAQWGLFAKLPEAHKLLSWISTAVACEVKGKKYRDTDLTAPAFYGRLGIFITIMKGKAVRGCFGAFDHKSESLSSTLREYIRGALASDPRYKPVDPDELNSIAVILTIADKPFAVSDLNEIDISRFGLLITKGDQTTILVPAEIRSKDRLKPFVKNAEVFAFKAVSIK